MYSVPLSCPGQTDVGKLNVALLVREDCDSEEGALVCILGDIG